MGAARPSILDEFDAISSRMREIREAESAALRCSCSKVISAQGEIITIRSALCRAHPSDEAASYLACPAALDLVQEVERQRELLSRIALRAFGEQPDPQTATIHAFRPRQNGDGDAA